MYLSEPRALESLYKLAITKRLPYWEFDHSISRRFGEGYNKPEELGSEDR